MAALQNGVPSTVVCGQVGAARLRWKLFFCVVYINCFMLLEVKGQYYTGDHPWAVKDHSEDVFHSSGDIDTQPKVEEGGLKPTKSWKDFELKRASDLNQHPRPPQRVFSESEIYRTKSNEDPTGTLRIAKQESASAAVGLNLGEHYNVEAGGIEDSLGLGAHVKGGLDRMIEPVSEKMDASSDGGGGEGGNTEAMVQAAREEQDADRKAMQLEEKEQEENIKELPKDAHPNLVSMKNEEADKRAEAKEQLRYTRNEGDFKRNRVGKNMHLSEEKVKADYAQRPVVSASEESAVEKLQANEIALHKLETGHDVDGNVDADAKKRKDLGSPNLRGKELGNPARAKVTKSGEGKIATKSAESDLEGMSQNTGMKVRDKVVAVDAPERGLPSYFYEDAPAPGTRPYIVTNPDTGATHAGGKGFMFQPCKKDPKGMCWLPYHCENHGGTPVSGQCNGGHDTVCCRGYQTKVLNPLPLAMKVPSFPLPMYEGRTTRLKGVTINLGEREEKLIQYLHAAGIGGEEAAQFLAQMDHESHHFQAMEEYASGQAYEGRADLGNHERGDGMRFKGRGYIQLTGRSNYRYQGQLIGYDLERNPTMASDLDIAAQVAINFWFSRVKGNKKLAGRFSNTEQVTKIINGGSNGLADRKKKFEAYKASLSSNE